MAAAILDLSPKRGFVMGGFGWTFSVVTHPQRNTFQVRKLCLHFVQPKSLFVGTTGGQSYQDIGTQVRETQNE